MIFTQHLSDSNDYFLINLALKPFRYNDEIYKGKREFGQNSGGLTST